MADDRKNVLVLGGGLAGVCAAYTLAQGGMKVIVVDQEDEVGGLAKSRMHESPHGTFSYDIGPHRFHSTEERIQSETEKVLADNKVRRDRVSRILLYDQFFDYPLKLNKALTQLPKPVMIRAMWDYLTQSIKNLFVKGKDDNFEAWVVRRFGRKLFEIFFGVYTAKTWGRPCLEISADWASQRISQASLWDTIKKSLFRPKGDVRSLVSNFVYPKTGGIGEIARSYRREAEKMGVEFHLDTKVEAVVIENGRALGARVCGPDGESRMIEADQVLNTIPLTSLVRMLEPAAPQPVIDHVNSMSHRSMVFVYLILDRPQLTHDHWIYIPEDTLTVHRLSEFKNFSEECAPADKTLICAEITCDFGDEIWNKSDDELRKISVDDLIRIGLIQENEVLETFTHREFFAYPLYTLGYRQHLEAVIKHVEGIEDLDSTGRQGLFKYNNMDHSVAMGFTAADNILGRGADHKKVASGDEYFG